MAQNVELERVKRRIRALVEKTTGNGCTEEEAVAAMVKVGELLAAYRLTMDEVTVREDAAKCRTVRVPNEVAHYNGLEYAIRALGEAMSCRTWCSRTRAGRAVAIFGTEADTDLAQYLATVIRDAAGTELAAYRKSPAYRTDLDNGYNGRAVGNAFLIAFAGRISGRLRDMKKAAEAEMAPATQHAAPAGWTASPRGPVTGGALVVLKDALVKAEFAKTGVKIRSRSSSAGSKGSNRARAAGAAAANRVNLNRPLGGGSSLRIGA